MTPADGFRERFLDFVLSKYGKPYCWPTADNRYSGKDLPGAKYKDVYDCSGLVTSGLFAASGGKMDWRATFNCNRLFSRLLDVTEPKPGDLAFYGAGKNMVTHVMVVMHETDGRLGVYGACGGGSKTVTPEIAQATGARVRTRSSHLYRSDFLGFKRLPEPEEK